MTTNFQKVKQFNQAFRLGVPTAPQPRLFTEHPDLVRLKLDLIREEVRELETAVHAHDFRETVDALADILYVVYGAGIAFGIDMDAAFELVHQSNMSKLCKTEREAMDTVEWYREEFRHERQPYDSPVLTRDDETGMFIVLNQTSGKILKSIAYQPVDLSPVLGKTI